MRKTSIIRLNTTITGGNQSAFHKRGQGVDLGMDDKQMQLVKSERHLEEGPPDCESNALTTWSPCHPSTATKVSVHWILNNNKKDI